MLAGLVRPTPLLIARATRHGCAFNAEDPARRVCRAWTPLDPPPSKQGGIRGRGAPSFFAPKAANDECHWLPEKDLWWSEPDHS